jgi:hypothetical protein
MSLFKRSVRAITPAPIEKERLKRKIAEFSNFLEPMLLRPMNMVEVVKSARTNGHTLIPCRDFDRLPETVLHKNQSGMVWTGTLVISEREGKVFGEKVRVIADFTSQFNLDFEVPSGFRGKRGCLLLEYPDFEFDQLDENTFKISPIGWLVHHEGFPSTMGWYRTEERFGLPVGENLKERIGESKFLEIRNREFCAHISLVARDLGTMNRISVAAKASEKFKPLVKPIINPENYVYFVINHIKQGVNDIEKRFILDWMAQDHKLGSAIGSEIPGFQR